MGSCHQGLGDRAGAASRFVEATRADASDERSVRHLEDLVKAHPEILTEVPGVANDLESCREAVEVAKSLQPDFAANWLELRRKQKPADKKAVQPDEGTASE